MMENVDEVLRKLGLLEEEAEHHEWGVEDKMCYLCVNNVFGKCKEKC